MKFRYPIGVIGAGNMGGALIRGLIRSNLVRPYEILASGRNRLKLTRLHQRYKIHITTDNREIVKNAQTIILSVKPQNMTDIFFEELKSHVTKGHLILSIAAGVDIAKLQKGLGKRSHLVRVMPNLPALIDKGVSAIFVTRSVSPSQKRFAHQIFEAVGMTVDIHQETWMDAVTGLSGTGPAYFFALLEGMERGGKKVGLPKKLVSQLAMETLLGAANMVLLTGKDPKLLRQQVTSFRGTTWAAMKVFKKRNFWKTIEEGVAAATKRAKELRKIK